MSRLPISVESEKAAIGAVLLEPNQLASVLRFASLEDFCLGSHREILRAIVNLDAGGVPP